MDHVYRWVGLPESIVSDRGPQFVSEFWKEFCRILGIERKLSTAYHPQTDGQSEITNQYMAQRLRPFVNYHQDNWSDYLAMVDFAFAALPQETTGASPFFVERGYEPRVSFDWKPPEDVDWTEQIRPRPRPDTNGPRGDDAQEYTSKMREIWEETQRRATSAQERQRQQADAHRRKEDFNVGDRVYVTSKNWRTDRPGRKLSDQASGPYRIVRKVGNAYELELPDSIRVHPVFAPEKLRLAARTEPLPGQVVDPPPPIVVNEEQEWEVDEILAARERYRKLQYRVKWLGQGDEVDGMWYPARNFKNAPEKLLQFHNSHPEAPGPPKRLNAWAEAALCDRFEPDHPDDDASS